jgi:hypothetical protein
MTMILHVEWQWYYMYNDNDITCRMTMILHVQWQWYYIDNDNDITCT